jgi:hypothetical protein
MQRLRLEPQLSYEHIATLHVQADVLDDVVWGDNEQQTFGVPLFAEQPSSTNFLGSPVPTVQVKRAWLELALPVGNLRVGRQPSNWGLGILSNAGDGFDDDFGENHFGSTFDRIAFATKPFSILRALRHETSVESNFVFAYAYDKLSEEPCITGTQLALFNKGFDCTFLDPDTRFAKQQAERPFGSSQWLEHGNDDVQEHIFVLLYNDEKWHPETPTDQLKMGLYVVWRTQGHSYTVPLPAGTVDHGASIRIYDGYYKLRLGRFYSEAEGYVITGTASGVIPLGCPTPTCDKEALAIGAVWRGGVMTPSFDGIFEAGYASGDDDISDGTFKQRALHPDYNVGLLLYEEVLRQRTFAVYSKFFGNALESLGGVIDSYYLFPRVRYRPRRVPGLEGLLGVVLAWRDQADEFGLFDRTKGRFLGLETDAAVKYSWAEDHLNFTLQAGLLVFGDALSDYTSATASTLQSRLAFLF